MTTACLEVMHVEPVLLQYSASVFILYLVRVQLDMGASNMCKLCKSGACMQTAS